jgi:hypothetical protein
MKRLEQTRSLADLVLCPACGQRDGLTALGERIDRPYRWRPWATMVTEIYLCGSCDALLEVRAAHWPGM